MIRIFYLLDDKFTFEPFLLGYFSGSRERLMIISPDSGIVPSSEDVVFPDDFSAISEANDFNSLFDYSILPDHGIFSHLSGNVFSFERKGRLYRDTANCVGLPFFRRTDREIKRDMEILRMKFRVSRFVLYTSEDNDSLISVPEIEIYVRKGTSKNCFHPPETVEKIDLFFQKSS